MAMVARASTEDMEKQAMEQAMGNIVHMVITVRAIMETRMITL